MASAAMLKLNRGTPHWLVHAATWSSSIDRLERRVAMHAQAALEATLEMSS